MMKMHFFISDHENDWIDDKTQLPNLAFRWTFSGQFGRNLCFVKRFKSILRITEEDWDCEIGMSIA